MVEKTSRLSTTPELQRPASSLGTSCPVMGTRLAQNRRQSLGGSRHGGSRPGFEIGPRPRAQGWLLHRLFLATEGGVGKRRKQPEIDVHRLKGARARVDGFDMSAGNVAKQRAVGR